MKVREYPLLIAIGLCSVVFAIYWFARGDDGLLGLGHLLVAAGAFARMALPDTRMIQWPLIAILLTSGVTVIALAILTDR